jgi:5'-3' exonuclease
MSNFTKMTALNPDYLMVVDALNLAFRYKHARSTDFVEDYIKTVKSLQTSYKCGKVIITSDFGSSSWRKAIYPEYKANRKDKFETQTAEEAFEFEQFLEEFERVIQEIQNHFLMLRFEKVEADDIAAYVTKLALNAGYKQIWLISSDRDWDLLVCPEVSRFSYVTRKEVTFDNWATHYDCLPEEYISMKCLAGDTGDNIPGVDGIGPKRSAELIREYGTAFDIVAALPIASKYKYIQNLNKSGSIILLNYQLMDLVTFCEEAIGAENCVTIHQKVKEYLA